MPVDPQVFKQAMSQFASGVTVVTTVHEGKRYGLTASSFSSLSLDPPLVLVCLARKTTAHGIIERSGVFAVNVLAAEQLEFGMRFAGLLPGLQDRFHGIETTSAATGSPLLPGVMSWVDCKLWSRYDGGDHSIFVGEVIDLAATAADTPLLYHNRLWRRSEALEAPTLPLRADLTEVGLVDGALPPFARGPLVSALVEAGVRRLQVASFLPGAEIPPPALPKRNGLVWSALVADERGVELAAASGLTQVDLGVAASDATSRKTTGRSPEATVDVLAGLAEKARASGLAVRVGILCAFASPDEGNVAPRRVIDLTRRIVGFPLDELALVDSAGRAHPQQVRGLLPEVRPFLGNVPLVLHLRDTRGMGLANVLSALKSGAARFDTGLGGRGGSPFLAAGRGNVATENAVHMLHEMGIPSGIDLGRLEECSDLVESASEGRAR
jgi:flavin reductase (DIM6/NTAB) family NADH-FMN oxidoreductase RutF